MVRDHVDTSELRVDLETNIRVVLGVRPAALQAPQTLRRDALLL